MVAIFPVISAAILLAPHVWAIPEGEANGTVTFPDIDPNTLPGACPDCKSYDASIADPQCSEGLDCQCKDSVVALLGNCFSCKAESKGDVKDLQSKMDQVVAVCNVGGYNVSDVTITQNNDSTGKSGATQSAVMGAGAILVGVVGTFVSSV